MSREAGSVQNQINLNTCQGRKIKLR